MKTDQKTHKGTIADYWISEAQTGVWRTARKELVCCSGKYHTIQPGERYLDTGERLDGSPWATWKTCEMHANEQRT